MAPVLPVRYLLKVTHSDGLYVRTDPVPSDPGGPKNRLYTIPLGAWIPAYDVLPVVNGVYAVIVATQVKSEFVKVAESGGYDSITGKGTYCQVYVLAPQPYNPHMETVEALRDIANAIREQHDTDGAT